MVGTGTYLPVPTYGIYLRTVAVAIFLHYFFLYQCMYIRLNRTVCTVPTFYLFSEFIMEKDTRIKRYPHLSVRAVQGFYPKNAASTGTDPVKAKGPRKQKKTKGRQQREILFGAESDDEATDSMAVDVEAVAAFFASALGNSAATHPVSAKTDTVVLPEKLDAVSEKLDDTVSEKLDDTVSEKMDDTVSEKSDTASEKSDTEAVSEDPGGEALNEEDMKPADGSDSSLYPQLADAFDSEKVSKDSVQISLSAGAPIFFKGCLQVRVLRGCLDVFGATLRPTAKDSTARLYSPRSGSLLPLRAAVQQEPISNESEMAVTEEEGCVFVAKRLTEPWMEYVETRVKKSWKFGLFGKDPDWGLEEEKGTEGGEKIKEIEKTLNVALIDPARYGR